MSSQAWQQPFVNIFKVYGAGEWKKCTKFGEVAKIMDRNVKSSVYRLSGAIPSGNYIQFPKSNSLGLTGHVFYLLFKPVVDKFFSIHIDVAASDGVLVRISLSNLFKEFKSSATWLQFPVVSKPPAGSVEEATANDLKTTGQLEILPASTRWTLLCIDVQYMLSVYLNKHFAYFKSLRLCSTMLVKNAFTSGTCYEPGLDIKFARKAGLLASGVVPLPSEMSFPLEKHEDWHQKYDYIKFPSNKTSPLKDIRRIKKPAVDTKKKKKASGSHSTEENIPQLKGIDTKLSDHQEVLKESKRRDKVKESRILKTSGDHENKRVITHQLPAVVLDSSLQFKSNEGVHVYASPSRKQKENKLVLPKPKISPSFEEDADSYDMEKYQSAKSKFSPHASHAVPKQERKKREKKYLLNNFADSLTNKLDARKTFLSPDPILSLKKVVGFGGGSYIHALWSSNGDLIVYPCYGIIVNLNVKSGEQNFLLGHNSNITALAVTDDDEFLASAQAGEGSVIRLWNLGSRKCVTVLKSSINDISKLSFSKTGNRLCGVGEDSHFKQVIIVWNVSIVKNGGKISIVAKAHTESSFCLVNNIKFVPFDEERLVSCGNHNIRVWRIKANVLRSCPVDLGQHASIEFTDFVFHNDINKTEKDASKIMMYFTANNGWTYRVSYNSLKIVNVKKLTLGDNGDVKDGSLSLNCIDISEHFCAVGSQDGFLRLWPLNFKSVFLEAEHDSPVSVVSISGDRTKVFAGTTSGNLGFLDVTSRVYTTITRSHSGEITSFSFNKCVQQIATISSDNSIKLWDEESLSQVYDFQATNEKPTAICCHPMKAEFACGFKSGAIRFFSLTSSSLLYELKEHLGSVHSILFHPSGQFLYSAATDGTLIIYERTSITGPYTATRTLPESVNKESITCHTIALDVQGRYFTAIGSSPFLVSLYEANSLDELLRIDITSMVDRKSNVVVDEAVAVHFSPLGTLLVFTSTSRMLKLDCSTGQILSQVSNIHRGLVQSVSCSADGKYLVTAGDRCIKVWDYLVEKDLNFQVFIGHCSPVARVEFSPDGKYIISVGESLFKWDFLAQKSVMEMYSNNQVAVEEDDSSLRDHVQAVKSAHVPPEPIEQLGILELSSATKVEEGGIEDEEDLMMLEDLDDNGDIDFNVDLGGSLVMPDVIEVSSEKEEPVVTIPDNDGTGIEIISRHTHPKVTAHYRSHKKSSRLAEKCYAAPADQAGMTLNSVVGCDSNARRNVVWHPETGLFLYTSGCLLVIEDLKSGKQSILQGHVEDISSLGIKNDGQVVATGGSVLHGMKGNPQIFIWDLSTRSCDMVLEKHSSSIVSLQYSRDDRFLVSVSDYRDCSFIVWCAKDYYVLNERKTVYPVHCIVWNPFVVNELCSVGRTEGLLFWNLEENKLKYALEVVNADIPRDVFGTAVINKDMTALCYLDAHVLFTATSLGVVCAWNLKTRHCMMHWQADDKEIDVLAAKPGRLITGGLSKRLRIWSTPLFDKMTQDGDISDLDFCSVVMEDEKELDDGLVSASFDDDLEMGVIGTLKGTIWYISFEEDASIHIVSGHHSLINQVVTCCGDEKYFATCSKDGSLRLWNSFTREQTAQFLVLGRECNCVTFCSRPRESLASSKSEYNQIIHPVAQHKEHPSQCIAGYSDGTVRMFDFGRMEKLLKMKPHSSPVVTILCPIDGRVIISGSSDGLLAISSMSTGLTIRVLNDHMGSRICQVVHQEGSHDIASLLWLATSEDCRISVWSADWMKDVCELCDWITFPTTQRHNVNKNKVDVIQCPPTLAAFSCSDLDLLIYTGYGLRKEVSFYSLSKRQVLKTVSLTEWALCMDLSPSGSLLGLGFQDRLVKLVDCSVGTFQDFAGHSDSVINLKFTNEGNRLITSASSELFIWDVLL